MQSLPFHTLHHLRSSGPSEQTLVCLAATPRHGLARVFLSGNKRNIRDALSSKLFFPYLTSQAVDRWLIRRNEAGQVIGGFQLALDHAGIWLLQAWIRQTKIPQQEQLLALPLREVPDALPETMDTLQQAMRWIVESWRAEADILSGGFLRQQEVAKGLRERLALPLGTMLAQGTLERELGWFLYEAELETLLPLLSEAIMAPLRHWLNALGLDDRAQPITLIPHGRLGQFPLQDALVPDAQRGKKLPFHATCKLTYVKKHGVPLTPS